MPAMNGTGPQGYGPMTGRGMGNCSGAAGLGAAGSGGPGYGMGMAHGFGRGRGAGYGPGRGMGAGRGMKPGQCMVPGRGLGWFAQGYQDRDERSAGANIRSALETRITVLKAELARTEDLLKASHIDPETPEGSGT